MTFSGSGTYLDSIDLNKIKESGLTRRIMLDRLVKILPVTHPAVYHPPVVVDPVYLTNFEDTATDADGTPVHVHAPETGTWATTTLEVQGNAICPASYAAATVASATPSIVFDAGADLYFDLYVDADYGVNGSDSREFFWAMKGITDERYFIRFSTSNASAGSAIRHVALQYGRCSATNVYTVDGTAAFPLVATISNPPGSTFGAKTLYRLGLTINAEDSVDIWTEPGGGGTKTVRVAGWNPKATADFYDVTHNLIGMKFAATTDISGTGFASWTGYELSYRRLKVDKVFYRNLVSSGGTVPEFTDPPYDTYDLPYQLNATDGTLVVLSPALDVLVDPTDYSLGGTDGTTFTFVDTPPAYVWAGIIYNFTALLSVLYPRDREGAAMTDGRLQLSYMDVDFGDTRSFSVTVTPAGRAAKTTTFTSATPLDGKLHVAILTRNEGTDILIHDATTEDCHLYGIFWEGERSTTRSVRGKVV